MEQNSLKLVLLLFLYKKLKLWYNIGHDTYYIQNAHGDVVNLTDKDGKVTKSYRYDAFGVEKNIDENDTNAFRYCGEYYDKETATVYLRARYYNPSAGRFTQRDSFAGKNEDPLSLNKYTYCHNNPIRYVDPSGHSYGLINGEKFSINSAWDAKKFNELKSGKSSSSQVATTTVPKAFDSPITGGLSTPIKNRTTYTTVVPHDSGPFQSMDEAALSFSNNTYSKSSYIRHEYAAIIYSKKSNNQLYYYYTIPNIGGPHSVEINVKSIPKKATAVAYIHTHPNSTSFSNSDKDIADLLKIDAYMADPNYDLHKYYYNDQTETITESFIPNELGEYEKIVLEGTCKDSWENHIVNGVCVEDFDCGNMHWPTP